MRETLLNYNPDLFRTLMIVYLVVVILAMIRYGLEKTWFIEHLVYTIGMFILTAMMGMQYGAHGYDTNQYYGIRNIGIGWGGGLIFYSVMMIITFLIRCLIVKTDYVQVNKKTGEVEIMGSFLWATVNATIWWGLMMFFFGAIGSLMLKIGQIESLTVRRIITIPFMIFVLGAPIYLTASYTKWVQKLINVGPLKKRIVKVQTLKDDVNMINVEKSEEK